MFAYMTWSLLRSDNAQFILLYLGRNVLIFLCSSIPAYSKWLRELKKRFFITLIFHYTHPLGRQKQRKYIQSDMSPLLSNLPRLQCLCWWHWRCWLGRETLWWEVPSSLVHFQEESESWPRRQSQTCQRECTRLWCNAKNSSSLSFQIQQLSSSLKGIAVNLHDKGQS